MRRSFFIVEVLVVGMLMLVLGGCCKRPVQRESSRDSIRIKETVRIDTVQLKGDSILVEIPIECDSITNKPKPVDYRFESSLSSLTVSAGTGTFSINSTRKPQTYTFPGKDRVEYRDREVIKKVTVTEFKTRKIDIYCRWFTGLALLAGLLFIIFKIYFR